MTRALGVLLAVLALGVTQAEPQDRTERDAYDLALDRAQEYASQGLVDKAVLLLDDTAEQAESAGNLRRAAEIRLAAAGLYRELGNWQSFIDRLSQGAKLAVGTDLEAALACHLQLALAQIALGQQQISGSLEALGEVFSQLPRVPDADMRLNLESIALTLRVRIQLVAAGADGLNAPASDLAPDTTRVLEVLLSDDLRKTPSDASGAAAPLERQKPWRKRLLEVALTINDRVTELDGRYPDQRIRELEVAKDKSHRGTILGDLGRLDEAIAIKKETLAAFDRYNALADSLVDLDNICDLLIQKGVPSEALPYSADLIGRIESQTFVQVGQTTVDYLQQYKSAYVRHARLLWTQSEVLRRLKNDNAQSALNAFLIHADRSNFRGSRRDMAVYHDLGSSIGADADMVARLETALNSVSAAQVLVDRAVAEQKRPSDFEPAPGISINSPFRAAEEAKQNFITAIENIKRKETRSIGADPTITARMQNVVAGMTSDDGILMYFASPEGVTHAALITSADTRIFALGNAIDDHVAELAARLQQHVAVDPEPILAELSQLLLGKLPPLPRRLTIVLNDAVIGVPFEALNLGGRGLLVDRHDIRYALGLYRGVGARAVSAATRRAMIVGAETFVDSVAESLPQSRQEVEGIRAWLGRLGVDVSPEDALPQNGRSLLSDPAPFQVIHVSTHSRLDSSVPILDSLLFPRDKVYAHQLALSSLRSSLVVLSACELYRPRGDRLYPVSGVTTAALGRVSPQVISPMWEVNATATQVFMLRFYGALVESGDATAALAQTKRDFASGGRLRAWLEASGSGLDVSAADIEDYRQPYYWAPFVLALGVTADAASP